MALWPYLHPSISTALMRPIRPKQYCLQLVIYIYIYTHPLLLQKLLNEIGTFSNQKKDIYKCLRDRLVRSRFVNETPQNFIPKGFRACERTKCSWCKKINQTTTFTSPNNNKTYTIFHTVDCQSSWIIYIIECNICKLQYIGKSETAFNLRLNNHRNHINHSAL